ncbi:Chitinase 4 [Thecaphora frezii]
MKVASKLALLTAGLSCVAGTAARDARYYSAHTNGTAPVAVPAERRHEATPVRTVQVDTARLHVKRSPCSDDSDADVEEEPSSGKVNAAYFTNWAVYERKYFPNDAPAASLTHINYAFATIDPTTGKAILSDSYADEQLHYAEDSWSDTGNNLYGNFKQFLALKKVHRHLKLVLSIGGWTYSPLFAPMASDTTKRAAFVASAVDLVRNYGLDGLDIDWEFPDSAADAANFVSLLKELRTALDAYAARVGQSNPYIITIAAPCGPDNYNVLDMVKMDKYLTYWNLMGYDYSGGWSTSVYHQANLYGNAPSSSDCISGYLAGGASASKVVLGMPIYGRGFENTEGLGKSFNGVGYGTYGGGIYDYYALPQAGSTEYYDANVGASWSYDAKARRLISYDNPAVIKQKVDYLLSKGLAGAMFWELSGDNDAADRSLILAAANRLGSLDQTLNHLSYPESKFDNVRAGISAPPPPTTTTTTTQSSTTSSSSTSSTTRSSTTSSSTISSSTTTRSTSSSTTASSTTTSSTTTPTSVPKQDLGSACTAKSGCLSNSCVSGRCVPQAGQGYISAYCNLSSQCTTARCWKNQCLERKDYGGTCTLDETCRSNRCSPAKLRCIPTAGQGYVGAFCTNNSQCVYGLCTANACESKRLPGLDCTDDVNCLSNRCGPVSRKCIPQAGTGWSGSYCTNDSQCTRSGCVNNACR